MSEDIFIGTKEGGKDRRWSKYPETKIKIKNSREREKSTRSDTVFCRNSPDSDRSGPLRTFTESTSVLVHPIWGMSRGKRGIPINLTSREYRESNTETHVGTTLSL